MSHEQFMREAIAEAKKGDLPYGAVIVKDSTKLSFVPITRLKPTMMFPHTQKLMPYVPSLFSTAIL